MEWVEAKVPCTDANGTYDGVGLRVSWLWCYAWQRNGNWWARAEPVGDARASLNVVGYAVEIAEARELGGPNQHGPCVDAVSMVRRCVP